MQTDLREKQLEEAKSTLKKIINGRGRIAGFFYILMKDEQTSLAVTTAKRDPSGRRADSIGVKLRQAAGMGSKWRRGSVVLQEKHGKKPVFLFGDEGNCPLVQLRAAIRKELGDTDGLSFLKRAVLVFDGEEDVAEGQESEEESKSEEEDLELTEVEQEDLEELLKDAVEIASDNVRLQTRLERPGQESELASLQLEPGSTVPPKLGKELSSTNDAALRGLQALLEASMAAIERIHAEVTAATDDERSQIAASRLQELIEHERAVNIYQEQIESLLPSESARGTHAR